jgi:hypothetical protein
MIRLAEPGPSTRTPAGEDPDLVPAATLPDADVVGRVVSCRGPKAV